MSVVAELPMTPTGKIAKSELARLAARRQFSERMKLKSRYWWDLSTRDFAALDMAQVVALQPVGAVEQHGPHLPVRVDAAINEGIVTRALALMPDDLPVLVLPRAAGRQVERAHRVSRHAEPVLRDARARVDRDRRKRPPRRLPAASSTSTPMAASRRSWTSCAASCG